MNKLSVAVVTVTSGRDELIDCINSIDAQTYPCKHYILTDGIMSYDDFYELVRKYKSDNRYLCYWATKIGGKGLEGRRLFASAPHLINEDVIFYLCDDDWYKPNHVESLMNIINSGSDWAYSFRSIYDSNGNYLFDDNCESLGEYHKCWNTNHSFAETSSLAIKTECAIELSMLFNLKGYGVDRIYYNAAKRMFPNFKGSELHTVCFRLGGNEDSVCKEFFEEGNKFMMDKYNNKLPFGKD